MLQARERNTPLDGQRHIGPAKGTATAHAEHTQPQAADTLATAPHGKEAQDLCSQCQVQAATTKAAIYASAAVAPPCSRSLHPVSGAVSSPCPPPPALVHAVKRTPRLPSPAASGGRFASASATQRAATAFGVQLSGSMTTSPRSSPRGVQPAHRVVRLSSAPTPTRPRAPVMSVPAPVAATVVVATAATLPPSPTRTFDRRRLSAGNPSGAHPALHEHQVERPVRTAPAVLRFPSAPASQVRSVFPVAVRTRTVARSLSPLPPRGRSCDEVAASEQGSFLVDPVVIRSRRRTASPHRTWHGDELTLELSATTHKWRPSVRVASPPRPLHSPLLGQHAAHAQLAAMQPAPQQFLQPPPVALLGVPMLPGLAAPSGPASFVASPPFPGPGTVG